MQVVAHPNNPRCVERISNYIVYVLILKCDVKCHNNLFTSGPLNERCEEKCVVPVGFKVVVDKTSRIGVWIAISINAPSHEGVLNHPNVWEEGGQLHGTYSRTCCGIEDDCVDCVRGLTVCDQLFWSEGEGRNGGLSPARAIILIIRAYSP